VCGFNHLKLVHPGSHAPYDAAGDYVGFVPLTSRAWSVRPFPKPLGENRVVYIADTYGVTASDLGAHAPADSGPMLYGGLTATDLDALEGAVRSGATLIGEFNTAAEPTVDSVRVRAEGSSAFGGPDGPGAARVICIATFPPGPRPPGSASRGGPGPSRGRGSCSSIATADWWC
jgi:hypothetical protein